MSLRLETTLAGYGRAAVDLKTRMWEISQTSTARNYLRVLAEDVFAHFRGDDPSASAGDDTRMLDTLIRMTSLAWRVGEPYVLAPAMTAVVAAAADALDLTGERLPADIAPTEHGVLFLPQPVYHRLPSGAVTGIGAITWARLTTTAGRPAWAVFGWSDREDPTAPQPPTSATDWPATRSSQRSSARTCSPISTSSPSVNPSTPPPTDRPATSPTMIGTATGRPHPTACTASTTAPPHPTPRC